MLKEGGLDDFLHSVFNFPTLAECFKYAAYDGLQRLSHRQGGAPLERTASVAAPNAEVHPPAPRLVRRNRPHRPLRPHEPPGDARPHGPVATRSLRHVDVRPDGRRDDPRRRRRGRFRRRDRRTAGARGQGPDDAAGRTPAARPGQIGRDLREGRNALRGPHPAAASSSSARCEESGLGLLGEAPWETTALLEVYPGDAWPKWAGRRPPKKTLPAGRRARYDILREHGLELPVGCDAITHDQLDAAAAAFTAYLWATGNAREFGDPPVWDEEAGCIREGIIVSV